LSSRDDDAMSDVRRALAEAGFDENAVAEAVREAPFGEAAPLAIRRRAEPLLQLFLLGDAVPSELLPVEARTLEAAGLIERDGDRVRPAVRLFPYEDLLIANDLDDRAEAGDYVPGVTNASRTLAALTIRRNVGRALDLGTGCGLQALLLTRHAETVVATDLNPRALEYVRLNAQLNGRSLETAAGNWFEPVANALFDLIAANPPFVISPDNRLLYRDSELGGEEVCRLLVRGAAARLRQDGHATVLCNWVRRSGGEPWAPLADWVTGTGCDALLLANRPVDPFRYAAQWNEPLLRDRAAFDRAVERWLEYYEREGIGAIGVGAVVLRRRDGDNWLRGYELLMPATGAAGRQLQRLFAAADRPLTDDDLLRTRFRLVEGHRLDQTLTYRGVYDPATVRMTLADGVGLVGLVDAATVEVLFAVDPCQELGRTIADLGAKPTEVLPTVRRLYEGGFLERG
jgi:SAM-dependent methyltransferase